MEKTLTRLRSNLKSRRKLSLPMLVSSLHWNGHDGRCVGDAATPSTPIDGVGSADVGVEATEEDLGDRRPRSWLSMSRSRNKKTNKPRRWPSTPAIVVNRVASDVQLTRNTQRLPRCASVNEPTQVL